MALTFCRPSWCCGDLVGKPNHFLPLISFVFPLLIVQKTTWESKICNIFFLRNEERGTQNNVYMASTPINEWKKNHFLHDVEKLALNHCIKHKCNGVYKITIVIVNHFYEELKIHVHQQRASNFLTTWVIKFYSFQANKTFHSRMQDTKTFLTFILCHAYTS